MMSKKNFLIVLLVFCVYVFLGALIFHAMEVPDERRRIEEEIQERKHIIDAFSKYHSKNEELFDALEKYCGKPIKYLDPNVKSKWDLYHSIFFVITVVSTIGYGNLAPKTMIGRIFMIFYALVGIPINGYIMLTLGEFFGKSFTKLYNRWKDSKRLRQVDPSKLGLVAQIILYLIPGFTFFIFVPSIVISAYEGWNYDIAVYYAFVTLTTIGFGDFVAGEGQPELGDFYYIFYQIFLIVWIIGGLGYVVMILNFIAKGMRSKKLLELEHRIASNIMKTPTKIRQELRSILEEFLMVRVKKIYKEFDYKPQQIERSQSCPDLSSYRVNSPHPERKRAFSECAENFILQRIQSETDLERIDKELTFQGTDVQADLIIKVVDALSVNEYSEMGCYEGFSDQEILASEQQYDSDWSLSRPQQPLPSFRHRAASDARYPMSRINNHENEHTWYGQSYLSKYAKLIKDEKFSSLPDNNEPLQNPPGIFRRIKNTILKPNDKNPISDLEKGETEQKLSASCTNQGILENTSVADLIRALSAISSEQQGNQLSSNSQQMRTRRMPIRSNFQNRRSSLMPPHPSGSLLKPPRRSSLVPSFESFRLSLSSSRRTSLAPVSEIPSSHQGDQNIPTLSPSKIRRFSVRPVNVPLSQKSEEDKSDK